MDNIIPIREGQFPVNARDLHEFLQVGKDYTTWIRDRIYQYGFLKGLDWQVFPETGENPIGGRPTLVFEITLSMAKELSMVERNERGQQARRYFIACEEKLKAIIFQPKLPASYAEALRELADTVDAKALLEAKIAEDKPAVEFAHRVKDATGTHTMAEVARLLGWPRNVLFAYLRKQHILMSNNTPLAKYMTPERPYFKVIENLLPITEQGEIKPQTLVTPRGLIWLQKVVPPYIANKKSHMSGKLPEARHA